MLEKSINDSFRIAKERNWKRVYWAIDLHGVIIKPTYSNEKNDVFYKNSILILKELSDRSDMCLILFTCSYEETTNKYLELFKTNYGITFDYVNCNPEVSDNEYSTYSQKLYYNVLLEDKAGFDPENDWDIVHKCLIKNKSLDIN